MGALITLFLFSFSSFSNSISDNAVISDIDNTYVTVNLNTNIIYFYAVVFSLIAFFYFYRAVKSQKPLDLNQNLKTRSLFVKALIFCILSGILFLIPSIIKVDAKYSNPGINYMNT